MGYRFAPGTLVCTAFSRKMLPVTLWSEIRSDQSWDAYPTGEFYTGIIVQTLKGKAPSDVMVLCADTMTVGWVQCKYIRRM